MDKRLVRIIHYKDKKKDLDKINLGDKVIHEKWGKGIVLDLLHRDDDMELKIKFEEIGIKNLMYSYAPIKVVGR